MPLTQQRAVEIARACGFNTEKNALVMRDADSAARGSGCFLTLRIRSW